MAQSSGDAIQQGRILHQNEIAAVLRQHMRADAWVALPRIYDIVEVHTDLTAADLEPEAPGSTQPRWKRNVRNFLQARKARGEFDWDGDARYRRRRVPASAPTAESPRRMLRGRETAASTASFGRPYAYGLAAGGQEGVEVVVRQLLAETDITLALLGGHAARDLDRSFLA